MAENITKEDIKQWFLLNRFDNERDFQDVAKFLVQSEDMIDADVWYWYASLNEIKVMKKHMKPID